VTDDYEISIMLVCQSVAKIRRNRVECVAQNARLKSWYF